MVNKVFYERPNSNKNDSQKEVIQENLIQEVVVEAEYENQYDSVPVNYQQERKDNQKEAIKKLVTNIILSILTVIFVILLVGFIYEMSEIGYRYEEDEENFSLLFSKYVAEVVDPDYVRAVTSFLNYDAIRRQLLEGNIPKITYKKTDGGTVVLSVYKLGDSFDAVNNTLWVFAKAQTHLTETNYCNILFYYEQLAKSAKVGDAKQRG